MKSDRIEIILLAAAMLTGCECKTAGEVRQRSREASYSRLVSAERYEIEILYLPQVLQKINELGLQDSVRLTGGIKDSLRSVSKTGVLTFCVVVRPKLRSTTDSGLGSDAEIPNGMEVVGAEKIRMADKAWIETDGHRIPLSQFHMENSFGMYPGRAFTLQFRPTSTSSIKNGITLVLQDLVPGLPRRKIDWVLPLKDVIHQG